MSTPVCNSCRYVSWLLGRGVSKEGVSKERVGSGMWATEREEAGVLDEVNAAWGTDFNAMVRTSTVSKRSNAKRVMAKSRVCSFSRAALRCRFKKSACR